MALVYSTIEEGTEGGVKIGVISWKVEVAWMCIKGLLIVRIYLSCYDGEWGGERNAGIFLFGGYK
jgi:hypothetical protein